jgi:subtilisin family serine protease
MEFPALSQMIAHKAIAPAARVQEETLDSQAQRLELMARLGVTAWHKAGFQGKGVKIAVLDSGFRGYRDVLGKGLPAAVTVRSFRSDNDLEARDSQHGILCGEVIHTLAPEAELVFANWDPEKPETFLSAAQWAKDQGAKILSCSLIMPSWSDGEGGGKIDNALTSILGDGNKADDLLFFASAGNTAQRHWSGRLEPDAAGWHQWTAEHRSNALTPWSLDRVSIELYGKSCQGVELRLVDAATGNQVGTCKATAVGSPSGCPCAAIRFLPQPGARYQLQVRGAKPGAKQPVDPLHLVVLGGSLHYWSSGGSISCPADCSSAVAVGAVNESGERLNYSSTGPNSPLPKPDFVAEVPFPSLIRDRSFAGTSAAAPQAAALAALVWCQDTKRTGDQVRQILRTAARDLGPPGHDWETGHGQVRLPAITDGAAGK